MKIAYLAFTLGLVSCGAKEVSDLKRAWDEMNAPEAMGLDYFNNKYQYQNNFSKLPLEGALSETPWSGDYWATYRGGITFRWWDVAQTWNILEADQLIPQYTYDLSLKPSSDYIDADIYKLSPAEKYDLYRGDYTFALTRYERQRTQVMKTLPGSSSFDENFEIPRWEGLCHAWAPATMQYSSPSSVTMTNPDGIEIPFGVSDIKALLTYNVHINMNNVHTNFLGQRCELNVDHLVEAVENGEMTQAEYRKKYKRILRTSACADTNAGAFHITLANQIALMDEGFVIDVTRDSEVWNQGVYDYKTEVLQDTKKLARKAAPGTVRRVLVKTTIKYVNEINFSWTGELSYDDNAEGVKVYYYWLELDKDDEIIGGEWAEPKETPERLNQVDAYEKDDRPDFLWKITDVPFANGFEELEAIYKKSIEK